MKGPSLRLSARRHLIGPAVTAISIALELTSVSCDTGPEELSPLTGMWASLSGISTPFLTLDLLEGDGGEISGTAIIAFGLWELREMVEGTYAHPEVRFTVTDGITVSANYTGTRVDGNTIDGDVVLCSPATVAPCD